MKRVLANDIDDKDYGSREVQRIFWKEERTWYFKTLRQNKHG